MSKRILSLFTVFALCFSLLPVSAFAEGLEDGGIPAVQSDGAVAEVNGVKYDTLQEILDDGDEVEITLLDDVVEDIDIYASTTINMDGHSIIGNIGVYVGGLTLTGGIVDGTVTVDNTDDAFTITAPSDADFAITNGLDVISGSAYVSGAKIGVKTSLSFGGDELTISGSDRAVSLLGDPIIGNNVTLYGATDVDGDATLPTDYDEYTGTYTIYGTVAKKISTKQGGGITPEPTPATLKMTPESATVNAGETAEFTVTYDGTDALNAYVQKNGQDDTVDAVYDADTGKVIVTTTEEASGTYTIYVHEIDHASVQAKASLTIKPLVASDSAGNNYFDIESAIQDAPDGSTVTVVAVKKRLPVPDGVYVKAKDKGITLDLNGHSLDGYSINVGGYQKTGKLTVIDSSGGSGTVGLAVRDGGEMVFAPENVNTTLLQLEVYGGKIELRGGNILAGKWTFGSSTTLKLSDLLPSAGGYAYRYYRGGNAYGDWVKLAEAQSNTASTQFALAVMKCEHTDIDTDSNCCLYCGQAMAARNGISYYPTVEAALDKANANDTITLLKNSNESIKIRKNITINLNNYRSESNITIYSGSTLKLDGSGTVNIVQTGLTDLLPDQTAEDLIGGALDILSDGVIVSTLVVQQSPKPEMNLSKGTFYDITLSKNLEGSMTVNQLLADGYAFAYPDETVAKGNVIRLIGTVKVVEHKHKISSDGTCDCGFTCDHSNGFTEDGKCKDCGLQCPHTNVDTTTYICGTCNMQMVVRTEKEGAISYNADLADAMNNAEDGATVTLLMDTAPDEAVHIIDNKTVTLDLNGHSVNYNDTFGIGGTSLVDSNRKGKLIIKGKGDIKTGVTIWSSGVLDLSGWTGTEMYYLGVYGGSTVTGIPDNAHIELMSLSAWQSSDRCVVLNGGSFDSICWSNGSGEPEIMLGYLLEDGYAFQQTDGQLVSYTKTLNSSDDRISNVKVVKCTEHADSDSDGKCDYCNGQLAARVDVRNGGSYFYTDFQDAVDSIAASGVHTVTLLADATGSYTVTKGSGTTFKLNGKTVNEITCSGESNMAFNESGTVNSVIFKGSMARFNAGNQLFTINAITIKDGATWSSILPNTDAEMYGYLVYNSDQSAYKWYNAGMLEEFDTINNVKVRQLPVTKAPILRIDGQEIAEQSSISVNKSFVFSFESYVTNGWGSGVLFIQKDGDSAPTPENADGDWKIFTCSERTFDISQIGTYKVWAEVSKDGYTRTSKIYTLNVGADLNDAQIALKQFTYTPLPDEDDAEEFTAEIESVTLFGEAVPADAYTVSGETTGKDAGDYEITITANPGSDYIGSKTVNWTINPCVLSDIDASMYRSYDGTTVVTADSIGKNNYPPHFFYNHCPAGGIALKYGEDYSISTVDAKFWGSDVGEHGVVSFVVELKNSNYIFKDEDDNYVKSKTVNQDMYIVQADLPADCEPDTGSLVVRNGVAHDYSFNVSGLLKELPKPQKYGSITYSVEDDSSLNADYYDKTAAIDNDGNLTLPIKEFNTTAEGDIGTVRIKVSAKNYKDFYITLNVSANNRIVLTGEPTLDKNEITYGDTIGSIGLSGNMYDSVNKVEVEGTFTWNSADSVPSAGTWLAGWTFKPTGDNAYMYAAAGGDSRFNVKKADLTAGKIADGADYEAPAAVDGIVYDGQSHELITAGTTSISTTKMQYKLGEDGDWKDTVPTATGAGEYEVYYKVVGDKNHNSTEEQKITCNIAKRRVTISNKPGDEGYKTEYMYGDIIQEPDKSNFDITGSEDGSVISFKWIG